ncbi:MAG: hypothetical protein ACOCUH_01070 [Bacteriovoracia bacterium]
MSSDWQFGIAYNAAFKLCTILLRTAGYRTSGGGSHHITTFALMPKILGNQYKDDADYLDACRKKRNIVEYDMVGGATDQDAAELREFVEDFKSIVQKWVSAHR